MSPSEKATCLFSTRVEYIAYSRIIQSKSEEVLLNIFSGSFPHSVGKSPGVRQHNEEEE